jgi:hypothetical protein
LHYITNLKVGSDLKKYLLLFFAGLLTLAAPGQKKKPVNMIPVLWEQKTLHFGFSLGLNAMDFNIVPSQYYLERDSLYPEVSQLNPGINIQIVSGYRPTEHLEIRFLPGVSFGQRNIRYYKNKVLYNSQQRLESSFLEFPLLVKYKGERMNNIKPYLIGGFNYRYDLAAKKEIIPEEKPVYIRIRRPDLYYEAGAGLDFYLAYFKLSVELKMSQGFRNVIVNDVPIGYEQYKHAIESMKSQIWVLAFHFE